MERGAELELYFDLNDVGYGLRLEHGSSSRNDILPEGSRVCANVFVSILLDQILDYLAQSIGQPGGARLSDALNLNCCQQEILPEGRGEGKFSFLVSSPQPISLSLSLSLCPHILTSGSIERGECVWKMWERPQCLVGWPAVSQ